MKNDRNQEDGNIKEDDEQKQRGGVYVKFASFEKSYIVPLLKKFKV